MIVGTFEDVVKSRSMEIGKVMENDSAEQPTAPKVGQVRLPRVAVRECGKFRMIHSIFLISLCNEADLLGYLKWLEIQVQSVTLTNLILSS